MRFGSRLLVGLVLVGVAFAQPPGDELRSKIRAVRYSRLAEQARIQGDVHLTVKSGLVTLVSGHPLLAPIAVEGAKAVGSIQSTVNLDLTYHFVLVDTTKSVPTSTTVPRGNAFTRAVLRVFGRKTEKVVHGYQCEEGAPPANELNIADAVIEIWIFGTDFCLQTNTATLVAKR